MLLNSRKAVGLLIGVLLTSTLLSCRLDAPSKEARVTAGPAGSDPAGLLSETPSGSADAAESPTPVSEMATAAPLPPTPTPDLALEGLPTLTPPLPPTVAPPSVDELILDLEKYAATTLPTPAADSTGFEGVTALFLTGTSEVPMFAVNSTGIRTFDPVQNHFAAIYQYDGGWQELARLPLQNPDYLFESSMRQALLGDGQVWLEVESGVGAHGSCYDLLRFDGAILQDEVSHCHSSSPAAFGLGDLDGDGNADLLLNQTDDYVFCYACGVRLPSYTALSWDGSSWTKRGWERLPEGARGAAENNRAVDLAEAGLWKDAGALINQATSQESAVTWNRALIGIYVEQLAFAADYGNYPLLDQLFYGDYEAVLELIRGYSAAELMMTPSPLIAGSAAEGWESDLSYRLVSSAEAAVAAVPDLATAHFLLGWGIYIENPADPMVDYEFQRAVELSPSEAVFSDTLAYLRQK